MYLPCVAEFLAPVKVLFLLVRRQASGLGLLPLLLFRFSQLEFQQMGFLNAGKERKLTKVMSNSFTGWWNFNSLGKIPDTQNSQ